MKILDAAVLELPCNACGGHFELPLVQILQSQEIVHGGCQARSSDDCSPVAYSSMLPSQDIEALEQAWSNLERHATATGGRLTLHPAAQTPREQPADR